MFGLSIVDLINFLGNGILVLGYISNNSLFPESLSPEEEKKYILKMKDGDLEAKDILIEHNLRLVAHVCKKYTNSKMI